MGKKTTEKVTIEKKNDDLAILSRALKEKLAARHLSPEEFVKQNPGSVSVKTIYNIINMVRMPQKGTLEAIEKGLGIKTGSLILSYTYFDWEYFYNKTFHKFKPYAEENEDLWDNSPELMEAIQNGEIDPSYGEPSFEDFLIIRCGMSYSDHIIAHKMPSSDIKEKVAEEFDMEPEKLFIPYRRVPYMREDPRIKYPKKDILTHLNFEDSEKETMLMLFNKIRPEYQKLIYNSIIDYYVLSQKR